MWSRRYLPLVLGAVLVCFAALMFPRVLGFVELAARELRYLWWLILLAALGVWLTVFLRKDAD